MQAVKLRLDGATVAETAGRTGLSAPTVSAAWKAFCQGGWDAVPVSERGRPAGRGPSLTPEVRRALWQTLARPAPKATPGWSSTALAAEVSAEKKVKLSRRSVEHWWEAEGVKPAAWPLESWAGERSARGRWFRHTVMPVWRGFTRADQRWQGGVRRVPHQQRAVYQLYAYGPRRQLWMRCFDGPPVAQDYLAMFRALAENAPAGLIFHGAQLSASPEIQTWLAEQREFYLFRLRADAVTG